MITELNLSIKFIKEQLAFLIDCGYALAEGHAPATYIEHQKNFVLIYSGVDKQIEVAIAINNSNVSFFIKRKLGDKFVSYNDKINFLYVDNLVYLKSAEIDDETKFSSIIKGRANVISAYSNLLSEYKSILCSDDWFNTDIIEINKQKYYTKKWGKGDYSTSRLTVMDVLTQATSFLLKTGYYVIEDTELLPPYQRLGWHIIYSNGTDIIKIHQVDWRDFYYLFAITVNDKNIFEAKVADYKSLNDMADHFVSVLKEAQPSRVTELNLSIKFIKEQLAFLVDCGYVLTEGYAPPTYIEYQKRFVLKFTSAHKQVEVAININNSNVSFYIKRKVGNKFAPYNDKINFLFVDDLVYLKSADIVDKANFSATATGRTNAIIAYSNLLKTCRDIICKDNEWFDISVIETNKLISDAKETGVNISSFKNKEILPGILTAKTSFLLGEGYHVFENADLLPPYQYDLWHLIYGDGDNIIRIQEDLREPYYTVYINRKMIVTVSPKDYKSLNDMADRIVYAIKEAI